MAQWHSQAGEILHSFTMLTLDVDDHTFMRNFHKPSDENPSIVILPPQRYDEWLNASMQDSRVFLRARPAELMTEE